MLEGDIDLAMYRMAARHFRLPVRLFLIAAEKAPFLPRVDYDSFVVMDDLEQKLGMIKVFIAENEEREKEIDKIVRGVKFLSSIGLKDVQLADPIDFEQAKVETVEKQYIALFTFPEGKPLLTHALYLAAQKGSHIEREQAFDILASGYRRLAKALAELHTKRFSPVCTISEYYWKLHMDTCRGIIKSLSSYSAKVPFDLADFADKLIRMAAAAYARPCSAGFLHGSPYIASVVYESFSGALSFVDLEQAHHSIDARGMPCGPCAYDFITAEASFLLEMTYLGAPYDEMEDIIYDYRKIYKNAMRDRYPAQEHLTFYNVLFWLPVYKGLMTKYNGAESAMGEGEKRIFRLAFTKIEPVLRFSGANTNAKAAGT